MNREEIKKLLPKFERYLVDYADNEPLENDEFILYLKNRYDGMFRMEDWFVVSDDNGYINITKRGNKYTIHINMDTFFPNPAKFTREVNSKNLVSDDKILIDEFIGHLFPEKLRKVNLKDLLNNI